MYFACTELGFRQSTNAIPLDRQLRSLSQTPCGRCGPWPRQNERVITGTKSAGGPIPTVQPTCQGMRLLRATRHLALGTPPGPAAIASDLLSTPCAARRTQAELRSAVLVQLS